MLELLLLGSALFLLIQYLFKKPEEYYKTTFIKIPYNLQIKYFLKINNLRPADSVRAGRYFFYVGKTLISTFLISIKKVLISMKNPLKGPNMCFSQVKKILSQTLQNPRSVGSFMTSWPTYLHNFYFI